MNFRMFISTLKIPFRTLQTKYQNSTPKWFPKMKAKTDMRAHRCKHFVVIFYLSLIPSQYGVFLVFAQPSRYEPSGKPLENMQRLRSPTQTPISSNAVADPYAAIGYSEDLKRSQDTEYDAERPQLDSQKKTWMDPKNCTCFTFVFVCF